MYRITSIAEMREEVEFGKPYAFRNIILSPASSFSQSQSLLSQSFGQRFSLNTAGEPPKKRKSVDVGGSPSKRSKSNSQSPDKARRDKEINTQTTSLFAHDDSSFDNRIFGCLVISPAGRAIRDFRSILQQIAHTYQHDLESFFYVLLWMCARRTWEREFKCKPEDRPKRNILTKWYTGSFDDIADAKGHHMSASGFKSILGEFPQAFDQDKPLCEKIRSILFPTTERCSSGPLRIHLKSCIALLLKRSITL